ncbi:MAG: hypothetical protein LBF92_03500 [Synergistaceae bacterium]|nr:hypothetical protein [Synergistaceae bacterium]
MKTKNLLAAVFLTALLLAQAGEPGYAYVQGDIHYYRFDDISGSSGQGAQWVAVTDRMNSVGAPVGGRHGEDIQTSGDIVNARDHIYIMNAVANKIVNDGEPIRFIFAALPGFETSPVVEFARTGEEAQDGAYDQVVTIVGDAYSATRTTLSGTSLTAARRYQFDLAKARNASLYGTERVYMRFDQDPDYPPSQALLIPLVLANVKNGSAEQAPLLFRTAVRDERGSIAAYDQFSWAVDEDKEVWGDDWVFVPTRGENINLVSADYRLVTQVRNFCGIRYELDRYDLMGKRETLLPKKWTMDLPTDVKDISPDIRLHELSHMAPGLITTYDQSFDVTGGKRNVFTVYAVPRDGGAPLNPYDLDLAHPLIFGVNRGQSIGDVYNVTGFQLLPSDPDFHNKAARSLGVKRIVMPSADVVSAASVTGVFVTADAIGTIKVNAAMPDAMLRSNDVTGILPLHVTFNLPGDHRFIGPKWDALVEEFKESGSVMAAFAENYSLYSYSSKGKRTDILAWLSDKDALEKKAVKVFVDEERHMVTLSFVVMLLDDDAGLKTLRDSSAVPGYSHDYLAMGDGNKNDAWDISFYVAPIGSKDDGSGSSGGGSSGGGCDAGASGLLLIPASALAALKIARRSPKG